MMKSISIFVVTLLMLCACHESIEERAQREAYNFTHSKCPTPKSNGIITDSAAFDVNTRTYIYYNRCCDASDIDSVSAELKEKIFKEMKNGILSTAAMQPYVEAGFNFRYIYYSNLDPKHQILDLRISAADLSK